MATVGELVLAEARSSSCKEKSLVYLDWLLPIFERVGIWDAEVYELLATSGPGWMDLMQPVPSDDDADVPALDLPEGQVRVIVLPCPEKENECTGKENG